MEMIDYVSFVNVHTEDIAVIQLINGNAVVLAAVEYWEEHPENARDDPYRILTFESDRLGNEWILNFNCVIKRGLFCAISEKAGEQCGGICFTHEHDREKLHTNEKLYDMYKIFNPCIIKVDLFEMLDFMSLRNGIYIVIVNIV